MKHTNFNIKPIGIIFDKTIRMDTTGGYCEKALARITNVEYIPVQKLHEVDPKGYSLFFVIDDGFDYEIPIDFRPAVYWAIDTHINFERTLARLSFFDLIFVAQKRGAEELRQHTQKPVYWLPLACDQDLHSSENNEIKEFDISFVGNFTGGLRNQLIDHLKKWYEKVFFGQAHYQSMVSIYTNSKIVFNCSIADDLNMRVFEGLASGSLLVTNKIENCGQDELFTPGLHFIEYESKEDLEIKLEYFLKNDEHREKISTCGQEEVLQHHTYEERMVTVLKILSTEFNIDILGLTNEGQAEKNINYYFQFSRPEIVELVPTDSKMVLDVGCGVGNLGAAIKNRQESMVYGIELNSKAAQEARKNLDRVYVDNVELIPKYQFQSQFDCIIFADVLEHLNDPETTLQKCSAWLKENGVIITSLPNIQNQSILKSLLKGNWTYQSAGILDITHTHFFTKSGIQQLFNKSGCEIEGIGAVYDKEFEAFKNQKDNTIEIGPLHINGISKENAESFFVYQYLIKSIVKFSKLKNKLTTIVIEVPYSHVDIQAVIENLSESTLLPFEVVLVTEKTDGIKNSSLKRLKNIKVFNIDEGAVNLIEYVHANCCEYLLFLNADFMPVSGWLYALASIFEENNDHSVIYGQSFPINLIDQNQLAMIENYELLNQLILSTFGAPLGNANINSEERVECIFTKSKNPNLHSSLKDRSTSIQEYLNNLYGGKEERDLIVNMLVPQKIHTVS